MSLKSVLFSSCKSLRSKGHVDLTFLVSFLILGLCFLNIHRVFKSLNMFSFSFVDFVFQVDEHMIGWHQKESLQKMVKEVKLVK
jgi:hypothetical protein